MKNKIIIDMIVRINDNEFPAEVLTKPEEIEKGMMGRESLDGCMVFKMNKGHHRFWMKKCLIPLDIVFVLNNRINRIHHNCPPAESHELSPKTYSGMGDHVIEFPGGTCKNFKVGDKVSLYLGTPQNPVN
jgi:uncharacterized membrane protein (UPF0127 family)